MTIKAEENNPYLENKGLPLFSVVEPQHLTPGINSILAQLQSDFDNFESKVSETSSYNDVLPVVERMQFPLNYAWGVAGHLNGVKNTDELREAYEASQPGVIKATTQISQSQPLYKALEALSKSFIPSEDFKDMQKQRAIENSLREMKLGGVGLEGDAKTRFNEIKLRLGELSTKFSNNVLDATKAYSLTINDKSAMNGVPSSAKGMWSQAHYLHLKSQATEVKDVHPVDQEEGPWRITLDYPSYIAAMQHLRDRNLREQIYRANITRASENSPDKNNIPLIYEILMLKQEKAKLLGFTNYAEQSLASKMALSMESVRELSHMIAEKALPAANSELEEITALARSEGGEEFLEANLEKLKPWDIAYWTERLKERKFDLTDEQLRPYFALPEVLKGMFGLVKRIFGIEVQAADGEAETWHPDVRFFKIFDEETQEHIASFYLDPYSRPADKRGGAWMNDCIGKSEALNHKIPVAYLICNSSPPIGEDTPSLMTFREVETLFHEFGHGLQHMLTRATVGDVAGINGIEWDAVELPSQFMENWCYDKATIYGFAKHYKTGEQLPEEMFEKLKQQKTFMAGSMFCRQLLFGQMDMELHANFDPKNKSGESIFDVHRRMASKFTPYSMPVEEDRFLCSFNHIFAGGYAAGYYSYIYAEVMSADCFGAFEEVGLENEEITKIGQKFRETVLALGGGVPPMDVFKQFRGREPSPEALLRHNGLA